jgi:tetratricopeptide (TPR) repeat protein
MRAVFSGKSRNDSASWQEHGSTNPRPGTWSSITKHVVDFDRFGSAEFANILLARTSSLAITGPPGIGKSTLLLWAIANSLERRSSWFKKVIFLSPANLLSNDDSWKQHLIKHSTSDTLLVADGLFRIEDDEEDRRKKTANLRALTQFNQLQHHRLGPFSVAFTIRDEEFDTLSRWWPGVERPFLPWKKLPVSMILEARLQAWSVKFTQTELAKLEATIREKSEGLPIYLELLASELAAQSRKFSRKALNEFPTGMANLVWQIIHKNCPPIRREPVLSIIKLLSTGARLSDSILDEVLDEFAIEDEHLRARNQRENICSYHRIALRIPGVRFFVLDNHWQNAINDAVNDPDCVRPEYRDAVIRYRSLDVSSLLSSTIARSLRDATGRRPKDAVIAADLVRLGAIAPAEHLTRLLVHPHSIRASLVESPSWDDAEVVLYNAWLDRAHQAHLKTDARYAFDMAFLVSELFERKRRLLLEKGEVHSYIKFLRNTVMVECSESEYDQVFTKIEQLYDRFIGLEPDDQSSWESKANFYREESQFDKAVDCCDQALKRLSTNPIVRLNTLATRGTCLGRWAKAESATDETAAARLFRDAQVQFEEALKYVRETEMNMQQDLDKFDQQQWNWTKQLLRQHHSATCVEEANQEFADMKKRWALQAKANKLIEESWNEDPRNPYTLARYAISLISQPDRVIPNRREVVKRLLWTPIVEARQSGNQPDPEILRAYARFLVAMHPPDFGQAKSILKTALNASETFWERNLARLGLVQLLFRWAAVADEASQDALADAVSELDAADETPLNHRTAGLVVRYKLFRARYFGIVRDTAGQRQIWNEVRAIYENRRFKTLEPLASVVTAFGDELMRNGDMEMARQCFDFAAHLPGGGWYPHRRLGELYFQEEDFDRAVDEYLKAADVSKGSKGPAAIRNAIYSVEKAERSKRGRLGRERQQHYFALRLRMSTKACELDSDLVKNLTDLAEDQLACHQYDEAARTLQKAHRRFRDKRMSSGTTTIDAGNRVASVRPSRSSDVLIRMAWNIGRARFGIFGRDRSIRQLRAAKRVMRLSARLADNEQKWADLATFENRWADPRGFVTAFQNWLDCLSRMKESEIGSVRLRKVYQVMRQAFFNYDALGLKESAAVANIYQVTMGYVIGLEARRGRSPGVEYGRTGHWFLKNGFPQMALECYVNAIRISHEFWRIAEIQKAALTSGRETLAIHLGEARIAGTSLHSQQIPSAVALSDIDRIVYLDALGSSAAAFEICSSVALSAVAGRLQLNLHQVRLVADGLIIAQKYDLASALIRLLGRNADWPERFFLLSLGRVLLEEQSNADKRVSGHW